MDVGLSLPQEGERLPASVVVEFAGAAEQVGFASLWVADRLLVPVESRSLYAGVGTEIPAAMRSFAAPLEVLTAAAVATSTVRLGTSVLVTGTHEPVELAKRLATLDQLSGGRVVVGLGLGWSEDEYEAAGVDFATRGARADEFIEVLLACWGPDPVSYRGEHFTVPASWIGPKPLQQPHPPLLMGMWSPAGVRRTIRWGAGWNPGGLPVSHAAEQLAAMNAERGDRPPLTMHYRIFMQPPVPTLSPLTVEAAADLVRRAAAAGFEEVIIDLGLWGELDSPEAWAAAPERMAPLLEAANP